MEHLQRTSFPGNVLENVSHLDDLFGSRPRQGCLQFG